MDTQLLRRIASRLDYPDGKLVVEAANEIDALYRAAHLRREWSFMQWIGSDAGKELQKAYEDLDSLKMIQHRSGESNKLLRDEITLLRRKAFSVDQEHVQEVAALRRQIKELVSASKARRKR